MICIALLAMVQLSFFKINVAEPRPKSEEKKGESYTGEPLCRNVIGLPNDKTSFCEDYIYDQSLYELQLDTLKQIVFWRQIMNLHEDTCLVNLAITRTIFDKMSLREWDLKTDSLKNVYKDSIRNVYCLDTTQKILITSGKSFFYDFEKANDNFHKGINGFIKNGVDPWYAQAILLIESPNKLQKSNSGAYGSFQLMKDVARMYGLKVNKHIDERANFERSAYAASSLIKKICIPYTKKILDSLKINNYNEHELWFRLLVMHCYHAGAYNVQKALFASQPSQGSMELIYGLWRTQTKRFKSASQNYSQLILAAMFEMDARKTEALQLAKL